MSVRHCITFPFAEEELQTIKKKMLNWLRPFSIFVYLDNNNYRHGPVRFELLAGAGMMSSGDSPEPGDWMLGHIAYDHKNKLEPRLSSRHPEQIGFADSFFFCPETVVYIPAGSFELHIATYGDAIALWEQIQAMPETVAAPALPEGPVRWQYRFSREDYLHSLARIRTHIEEGDCYELNFCTEAYAEQEIDPFSVFDKLNTLNPSPFAALYRNGHAWLMSASPERFLYREDRYVCSQPIKGTAGRDADSTADEQKKNALKKDRKEQAENVMITDLVRNDLAKSCVPGSVQVPELFGVYTFPQVHQLISTVTGSLQPGIKTWQVLEHAFPMGSMTGAPKVMVMELIEQYERSRRGLYSGTVGYVTPEGDFDFNVVIRSLLYNSDRHYLSYQTGGAITYESNATAEWEETRLKAGAMEQVFL